PATPWARRWAGGSAEPSRAPREPDARPSKSGPPEQNPTPGREVKTLRRPHGQPTLSGGPALTRTLRTLALALVALLAFPAAASAAPAVKPDTPDAAARKVRVVMNLVRTQFLDPVG